MRSRHIVRVRVFNVRTRAGKRRVAFAAIPFGKRNKHGQTPHAFQMLITIRLHVDLCKSENELNVK